MNVRIPEEVGLGIMLDERDAMSVMLAKYLGKSNLVF